VRRRTGEQPAVRRGTGEQPPIRLGSAEHPAFTPPPPPRHSTGDQPIVGSVSGRRAELRRQAGRTPVIVLAVAAVLLLAGLPALLWTKDASADPVFAGLDALQVPGWAAQAHQDTSTGGNRWCMSDCLVRDRTWRSAKPAKDTDPAYRQALTAAGWRQRPAAKCPAQLTGTTSCWEHDRYMLDLWTRDAACGLSNVAPAPGTSVQPVPSLEPSGAGPVPTGSAAPPPTCAGSLVTAKVTDIGNPDWHP
jgi:hypothetical protein